MALRRHDVLTLTGGSVWRQYGVPVIKTRGAEIGGEAFKETFTRPGTGSFVDAVGVLRTAGDNVFRLDWTGGIPGLLLTGNDVFTLPYYNAPMASQWYCRFEERDIVTMDTRVWQVGDASGGQDFHHMRLMDATNYSLNQSAVTVDVPMSPAVNDTIELLMTIEADGSVSGLGRKNGGGLVGSSPATAPGAGMPTAFSDTLLTVNSLGNGTNTGDRRIFVLGANRGNGATMDDWLGLLR